MFCRRNKMHANALKYVLFDYGNGAFPGLINAVI
jgi:hypothetical protein